MTQEGFKRKLTSIFSADAVGYSRLMGEDETATVQTITSYRNVISALIKQHNGNVIDSPGDNLLAEFVSVVDAVQCAVAVQKELKARNDELPENRRMQFRIGINLGDVIQEDDRLYGDGVNIAARLEALAEPGGICISKTAFDHIESKLPYGYDFIGDQTVKNIAKPVGAYRVLMEPRVTLSGRPRKRKSESKKRNAILTIASVIIVLVFSVGIWWLYIHRSSIEPASMEKMAYPLPDKPSIKVLYVKIGANLAHIINSAKVCTISNNHMFLRLDIEYKIWNCILWKAPMMYLACLRWIGDEPDEANPNQALRLGRRVIGLIPIERKNTRWSAVSWPLF
jgi:adenylate cyclase